jgi:hypothetical protein
MSSERKETKNILGVFLVVSMILFCIISIFCVPQTPWVEKLSMGAEIDLNVTYLSLETNNISNSSHTCWKGGYNIVFEEISEGIYVYNLTSSVIWYVNWSANHFCRWKDDSGNIIDGKEPMEFINFTVIDCDVEISVQSWGVGIAADKTYDGLNKRNTPSKYREIRVYLYNFIFIYQRENSYREVKDIMRLN